MGVSEKDGIVNAVLFAVLSLRKGGRKKKIGTTWTMDKKNQRKIKRAQNASTLTLATKIKIYRSFEDMEIWRKMCTARLRGILFVKHAVGSHRGPQRCVNL